MFDRTKSTINTLFPQKGVLVLLAIAVLLVVFVIILVVFSETKSSVNNNTIPTPTPLTAQGGDSREQKIAPTQKTLIKTITKQEIETLPNIENRSTLPNGSTLYTFSSPLISRKNEVLVQGNKVLFERILIPESRQDPGYVTISQYKEKYGQPQEIIRGSHYYGNLIETFIYADKGFSLIGNSFTDEVFEVHTFPPTTVDEYIQRYGEDINENAPAEFQ